jgi:ferredoxin
MMVMTTDRRGISCDLCGAEFRDTFDYYSAKIDKITVDASRQKTGVAEVDRRFMDLDICDGCWEKTVEVVKKVIEARKQKASRAKKSGADQWTTGA